MLEYDAKFSFKKCPVLAVFYKEVVSGLKQEATGKELG